MVGWSDFGRTLCDRYGASTANTAPPEPQKSVGRSGVGRTVRDHGMVSMGWSATRKAGVSVTRGLRWFRKVKPLRFTVVQRESPLNDAKPRRQRPQPSRSCSGRRPRALLGASLSPMAFRGSHCHHPHRVRAGQAPTAARFQVRQRCIARCSRAHVTRHARRAV